MKRKNEVRPDGEPCAVAECGFQPESGSQPAAAWQLVGSGEGYWASSVRKGGGRWSFAVSVSERRWWCSMYVFGRCDEECGGCGAEVTVQRGGCGVAYGAYGVRCSEQCVAAIIPSPFYTVRYEAMDQFS
nr:hypothetical protein Iba_chr04eCG16960 [Ipomoea batatas]